MLKVKKIELVSKRFFRVIKLFFKVIEEISNLLESVGKSSFSYKILWYLILSIRQG